MCITSVFKIIEMELSDMTSEEVLRSYSSVKRHRTWCECEIANLLELLQAQYSATLELRLNDRLKATSKASKLRVHLSLLMPLPEARLHAAPLIRAHILLLQTLLEEGVNEADTPLYAASASTAHEVII